MNNTNIIEAQASPAGAQSMSVYEPTNFQQLVEISNMMAKTSLIPDSLKGKTAEETQGNCFLVAEQSQRWGLSAFAVAQCASVIHGKLMWEGKLVAAVIASSLGFNLNYAYSGTGESMTVVVSGTLQGEQEPRTVTGSVKGWKTSQWKAVDYEQRLSYRGAREWARRHAPAVMLGVMTEDEEISKPTERNVTPMAKPVNPFEAPALPVKEEKPAEAEVVKNKEPKGAKGEAQILDVQCQEGVTNDRPWSRFTLKLKTAKAEITATTFSKRIGGLAEFNVGQKADVWISKDAEGNYKLEEMALLENVEGGQA